MVLHPKIQALRNSIGWKPIHYFTPSSKHESKSTEVRAPKVSKIDNDRLIQQYFCIWGIPDDYGTVPVRGAATKSIQERGPGSKSNYKILVLNQHDQRDPLCLPSVIKEDEIGLYAEYEPDPMASGDRLLMQIRRGTINNGSYGFNYVWDKMEYVEDTGLILMKEFDLFELSPVSIGSQKETFVVRNSAGEYVDDLLEAETESLIKMLPRQYHLELRSLISRHISLAQAQPLESNRQALVPDKPKQVGLDYNYLISKL